MRRVLLAIFILMMLCPVWTMAATPVFYLDADKEAIEKQDTITISVNLKESFQGNYRNLQGKLYYDTDVISYVSHEMDASYVDYVAMDMQEKGFFAFSNTDFTEDGFSEVKADTIVTIVFQVKKKIPRKTERVTFDFVADLQDIKGGSEIFRDTYVLEKAGDTLIKEDLSEPVTQEDTGTTQDKGKEDEGSADTNEEVVEKVVAEEEETGEEATSDDTLQAKNQEKDADREATEVDRSDDAAVDSQTAYRDISADRNDTDTVFWLLGIGGAVVIAGCIYKKWIRNKERSE